MGKFENYRFLGGILLVVGIITLFFVNKPLMFWTRGSFLDIANPFIWVGLMLLLKKDKKINTKSIWRIIKLILLFISIAILILVIRVYVICVLNYTT